MMHHTQHENVDGAVSQLPSRAVYAQHPGLRNLHHLND